MKSSILFLFYQHFLTFFLKCKLKEILNSIIYFRASVKIMTINTNSLQYLWFCILNYPAYHMIFAKIFKQRVFRDWQLKLVVDQQRWVAYNTWKMLEFEFELFQVFFSPNLIQIRENQAKKTLCIQTFFTQCNSLILFYVGKYCETKLSGKLVIFYNSVNESFHKSFMSADILIFLTFQKIVFSQVSF